MKIAAFALSLLVGSPCCRGDLLTDGLGYAQTYSPETSAVSDGPKQINQIFRVSMVGRPGAFETRDKLLELFALIQPKYTVDHSADATPPDTGTDPFTSSGNQSVAGQPPLLPGTGNSTSKPAATGNTTIAPSPPPTPKLKVIPKPSLSGEGVFHLHDRILQMLSQDPLVGYGPYNNIALFGSFAVFLTTPHNDWADDEVVELDVAPSPAGTFSYVTVDNAPRTVREYIEVGDEPNLSREDFITALKQKQTFKVIVDEDRPAPVGYVRVTYILVW